MGHPVLVTNTLLDVLYILCLQDNKILRICKTTDENNQKEEDDIEFLFPVVHFILVENVLAISCIF